MCLCHLHVASGPPYVPSLWVEVSCILVDPNPLKRRPVIEPLHDLQGVGQADVIFAANLLARVRQSTTTWPHRQASFGLCWITFLSRSEKHLHMPSARVAVGKLSLSGSHSNCETGGVTVVSPASATRLPCSLEPQRIRVRHVRASNARPMKALSYLDAGELHFNQDMPASFAG